jgi:hypothetical protein
MGSPAARISEGFCPVSGHPPLAAMTLTEGKAKTFCKVCQGHWELRTVEAQGKFPSWSAFRFRITIDDGEHRFDVGRVLSCTLVESSRRADQMLTSMVEEAAEQMRHHMAGDPPPS